MSEFFNEAGQPMTLEEWAVAYEHREPAIRRDEIGEVVISTVWLGINHRFTGDGPPLIFETMIFGGPRDLDCFRWSTRDEAIAGHEAVVAEVAAHFDG